MIDYGQLGQDYAKDAVTFAAELQKAWWSQGEDTKRIIELSSALCDMLFVATCLDQYGKGIPPELQESIDRMVMNARGVYRGGSLPKS